MHLAAAQIETPVCQPEFFGNRGLGKHVEWQWLGRAENFDFSGADLDLARRHGRIDLAFFAMYDFAIGANDGFFGEPGYAVVHLAARRDDQLRDAVVIGKIDKVNATVIAPVPQPSGQADRRSNVFRAQFAARVSSICVHRSSCSQSFEKVLRA